MSFGGGGSGALGQADVIDAVPTDTGRDWTSSATVDLQNGTITVP